MNTHKMAINKTKLLNDTQRFAIFGVVFGFSFPLVATIFRIFTSRVPFTLFNMLHVQLTDSLLWIVDTAPIVLGLFAAYAGRKQDLLSKINEQLRNRETELDTYRLNLEQRVNERTSELALANEINIRRAAQLETIARVSRTISSSQSIETLLPFVTETISDQFGFYHVGIFLLDPRRQYAVLVAANSEGGKRMLERNHRLQVGGVGIVGFVTNVGQARIALDVGQDAVFFNNPDLPATRSEIALPLKVGSETFGALDVQSTEPNAFTGQDVNILSTLADQVSIAIQNARSYQQLQEALAQTQASSAQLSGQQWKQYIGRQTVDGFFFNGVETNRIKTSEKNRPHSLAIPLTLRGVQIGSLKLSSPDPNRSWTNDEISMVQAAAERTAFALENARLLEDAQKRAAKERAIGEISSKIGGLVNIESIVQTAIQELGKTIPDTDVAIQFTSDNTGKK